MEEMRKDGRLGRAALRAGMHRNTARRYVEAGELPSELREPRSWRTREDPFTEDWPWIVERLELAPELEAKALFEHLVSAHPPACAAPGSAAAALPTADASPPAPRPSSASRSG